MHKYKTILIVPMAVFLLSGCADKVTEQDCLSLGHNYRTFSISKRAISCADLNMKTRVVYTYDKFDKPTGMGDFEDYAEIIPINKVKD